MTDTTGRCPDCAEPLDCQPDGHHCTGCGFHDDQACDRDFQPEDLKFPDMPDTIVIPRDAFNAILAVYKRRDSFRWAALAAPKDADMPPLILELAAAHAAGSTRLTPETAYKLSQYAASFGIGEDYDTAAEDAYWTVRDLIPADTLRELDTSHQAESAANEAEYIAWKAAQSEAGR